VALLNLILINFKGNSLKDRGCLFDRDFRQGPPINKIYYELIQYRVPKIPDAMSMAFMNDLGGKLEYKSGV